MNWPGALAADCQFVANHFSHNGGWLQERTIGIPDGGATVVALALKAVAEYVAAG